MNIDISSAIRVDFVALTHTKSLLVVLIDVLIYAFVPISFEG